MSSIMYVHGGDVFLCALVDWDSPLGGPVPFCYSNGNGVPTQADCNTLANGLSTISEYLFYSAIRSILRFAC